MIRRSKPLPRTSFLRRTRMRQVGRRSERDLDERLAFRANPPERCERCHQRRPVHAHHRLPRSRGGKHTADNRAWLCGGPGGCHDLVHQHLVPDWKEWTR